MMYSKALVSLALAVALPSVASAAATLDKPTIDPEFEDGLSSLNPSLMEAYPTTDTNELTQWPDGWIPAWCKKTAQDQKYSPFDVETFSVRYTDCDDPWIMCRVKNHTITQDDMIDTFGRIPARMRSYIRHVIAIPGEGNSAFNGENSIALFGTTPKSISVMIHEIGHSLDVNAYLQGSPFHSSANWLEAYNEDSAVADSYAASNQAENHSQELVIAMYDKKVDGGIQSVNSGSDQIFNQYKRIQLDIGNVIDQGRKCGPRLENTEAVQQAPSRIRSAAMYTRGEKPDVSISGETFEAAPPSGDLHHDIFDHHGRFKGIRNVDHHWN